MAGLSFLLLYFPRVWAANDDLAYQAEVPVPSQSIDDKNAALPAALLQVLVKVTGNENVLDNPAIKEALKNVNSLVDEYHYSTTNSGYTLSLQFNHEAITQLLQKIHIATPQGTEQGLSQVTLKIIGIMHRQDLDEVKNYFEHLAPVTSVEPVEVTGQEVVLSLTVRGDRDTLTQLISAETKLIPVGDLTYKWNP